MTSSSFSARIAARLFALALCLACAPLAATPAPTGKTASFSFTDLDGRPVRLADYRGQWVLVAFWAPWCPICKLQMPLLKQLHAQPGLTVIGVGLDYDRPEAVRAAAASHGLSFPIIAGGSRRAPDSPHRQVGPVDFFPTAYLYAPDGELALFIPGQINRQRLAAVMESWRPAASAPAPALMNTDRLEASVKRRFGREGEQRFRAWRQMLDELASADANTRLNRVNAFFNRGFRLASDRIVWGREDHWATLGEFLGKGAGDSEDFALAKYFTLLALNVPVDQLRLVYVSQPDAGAAPHMVLAYFERPDREPILLDHRRDEALPASQRPELRPIYSFNTSGAWGDGQGLDLTGGRPTPWQDTLRRAREEGFH